VLERSDVSIACEISCTTKPAHEVANLKKCLDAGFQIVCSIANSEEQRNAIERAARTVLRDKDLRSVSFITVDQIEDHLPRMTMPATNTEVIGYQVATKFVPLGNEQRDFKCNQLNRLLEQESVPAL